MTKSTLFMLLVLAANAFAQHRVPPPLEAADCNAAPAPNESPNAEFERKGGHISTAKVLLQQITLTVDDVAQGRDLARYEKLTLVGSKPTTWVERFENPVLAHARTFLWENWRDHRQAYLIFGGVNGTLHIFVEQDDTGRWRVSQRAVLPWGEVDDPPTFYSMEWVIRGQEVREPGTPLPKGQAPDAIKNSLEFRDKCGKVGSTF